MLSSVTKPGGSGLKYGAFREDGKKPARHASKLSRIFIEKLMAEDKGRR